MRIDVFLTRSLQGVSRSRIQQFIDKGEILLNGKEVPKRQTVSANDIVEFPRSLTAAPEIRPVPQNIPVAVLYEDDWLLAVNKPSGLVVHPGHGNYTGTLVNALLFRGTGLSDGSSVDRPGIVHRLDKETSGVVLIAKNNLAHARLADAFAKRTVVKQYLGICIGRPPTEKGSIAKPLGRSSKDPIKRTVSNFGKEALTEFELVTYRNGISVIKFFPRTGRTHQIRVHCNSAGFPILGDVLYGGTKNSILRINPAERPFAYKIYKCFGRHALHAYSITFNHPKNNDLISIKASLPDDFRDALLLFERPEVLSDFVK